MRPPPPPRTPGAKRESSPGRKVSGLVGRAPHDLARHIPSNVSLAISFKNTSMPGQPIAFPSIELKLWRTDRITSVLELDAAGKVAFPPDRLEAFQQLYPGGACGEGGDGCVWWGVGRGDDAGGGQGGWGGRIIASCYSHLPRLQASAETDW